MEIGPRNAEEAKLNEKFDVEMKRLMKKFKPDGLEFLIIGRKGDGIFINANLGCVHRALELAEIAVEKLGQCSDECDRKQAERN